jgi:hypothetical protein
VALIGGDYFQIIVIDAAIGTEISNIKDDGYFTRLGGCIAIDQLSNTIFLAGTLPSSSLSLMVLDILTAPGNFGPFPTMEPSSNNFEA